ncbi:unnamed protein product [Ascophyllum nodosum]
MTIVKNGSDEKGAHSKKVKNFEEDADARTKASSSSAAAHAGVCNGHASQGGVEDNEDVAAYLRNCRAYQVHVDPSVVISLKTHWEVIQPTQSFSEGSMLPLAGVLDGNKHVKKLCLRGTGSSQKRPSAGNGNSNARILRGILAENDTIDTLDISNTGLDSDGMRELCAALRENRSLTHLDVSRNRFGGKGAEMLEETLDAAPSLQTLDVRSNALGFASISKIQHRCCCRPPGCSDLSLEVEGNYVFEEVLNAGTHGLGFVLAIIGAIILMTEASRPGKSAEHFWGCTIFSISLMFLYLASTLFHSFFMLPYISRIFCVADHCAIYILIAGSYTPFMLISMHGHWLGTVIIIAQWMCALLGCFFSIASDVRLKSTMYVELSVYLGLGLAVLVVWESVAEQMQRGELILIAGGGIAYVAGIAFFLVGSKIPIFHTVWHIFVMAASAMHWFAVFHYTVHYEVPKSSSII